MIVALSAGAGDSLLQRLCPYWGLGEKGRENRGRELVDKSGETEDEKRPVFPVQPKEKNRKKQRLPLHRNHAHKLNHPPPLSNSNSLNLTPNHAPKAPNPLSP